MSYALSIAANVFWGTLAFLLACAVATFLIVLAAICFYAAVAWLEQRLDGPRR